MERGTEYGTQKGSRHFGLLCIIDRLLTGKRPLDSSPSARMSDDLPSWSARRPQQSALRGLLASSRGRAVFACGASSTGKRTVVLRSLSPSVHRIVVDCVVAHSERLLFSAIAGRPVGADIGEFVRAVAEPPHAPTAVILLRAERLCTAKAFSPAGISALLQLPQLAARPGLSVVLISRLPWPRFRDAAGLECAPPACVHFPPYSAAELVEILRSMYAGKANVEGVNSDVADELYPGFVRLVVDLLSTVTTDVRELHNISTQMFPAYLAPLAGKSAEETKSAHLPLALFNTVTAELKGVLQSMYRREFVVRDGAIISKSAAETAQRATAGKKRVAPLVGGSVDWDSPALTAEGEIDADLSRVARYLLLAAFLAGRNPQKHDIRYFTAERTRRPNKRGRKAAVKAASTGQAFSLERLLAIFEALREDFVDEDDHPDRLKTDELALSTLSTGGQVQIANLLRLGFLTSDSSGDPLADPKYRSHVSMPQAETLARGLRVELHQYLHVE